jgi:hypothetical protein
LYRSYSAATLVAAVAATINPARANERCFLMLSSFFLRDPGDRFEDTARRSGKKGAESI